MPFVSIKTTDDEWRREAVRLASIISKGPGSPHQRVEVLKQAMLAVAAENFTAGKAEGASAATPVSTMGEIEHLKGENAKLRKQASSKPADKLPVSDADLMEAMRFADANYGDLQNAALEQACTTIKSLAMEVAKLRYQAKAAAK